MIDAQLCPKGKSFGVICTTDYLADWEKLDDKDYQKQKEVVARTLLNRLEKEYPTILNYLEYYEVATPKTIHRYTLNPAGYPPMDTYNPQVRQDHREKNDRTPVRNLYFSSAWAPSGGCYSGAIYSWILYC